MNEITVDLPRPANVTPLPERRSCPRAPLRTLVKVSWPASRQFPLYTFTTDISGKGLFIYSMTPPEVGTNLELELLIDDDFRFKARGVVVRVAAEDGAHRFPGFAVRFTDLGDSRVAQLLDLVDAALARARTGGR